MNKIIFTIALIALISVIGYSQSDTTTKTTKTRSTYKIGTSTDTSTINLKNREILVIRNPIHRTITRSSIHDTALYHQKKKTGFSGTWTGIEFGFNNYLNNDQTLTLPADAKLLKLKTFNSYEFNWNILKKSYSLYKDRFGIVTGLGLSFNNYSFEKQVVFQKDSTPIKFTSDTISKLEKNKLAITYLTLPVIFEYQVPLSHSKLYISAGVIGSLKLGSKIKQIDNNDNKFVYKNNYNLSKYKLAGTIRIGYKPFYIYSNYSFTQLFKANKGPELYPFSIGIGLTY
jgi:hypothetical protein